MNGKGDKTRLDVNWDKYRAEHVRIFTKKRKHFFRFEEEVLDERGRFKHGLGETILGVK